MTALYRSTVDVARADLRAVLEREANVLERAAPLVRIEAERWGRMLFGVSLLLHAPLMALSAAFGRHGSSWPSVGAILAAAFPISLALGWLARRLALGDATRALRVDRAQNQRELRDTEGDPFPALAKAQARACPALDRIAILGSLERWSLLLPLLGFCLLAPLAMHLYVWLATRLLSGTTGARALRDFEGWVGLSVVFVGVAHASVLVYAAWFVRELRRRLPETMPSRLRPVWIATIASAFPGIIFIFAMGLGLLPMLITLVTGRILLPWVFAHAQRTYFAEKNEVTALENTLPPPLPVRFNDANAPAVPVG